MNKLRITSETPRDLLDFAWDVGRISLKRFIRYMNEVPEHHSGAAVAEIIESNDWPVIEMNDEEVAELVEAMHQTQELAA